MWCPAGPCAAPSRAPRTRSRFPPLPDVYPSEQLKCRTRGGNDGGYVKHGSFIYQLVSEQYYPHLKNIDHWKYVGEMVPEEELPEEIQEAFK